MLIHDILSQPNLTLIDFVGFDPSRLIKHLASRAKKNNRSLVSDVDLMLCIVCARGAKVDSVTRRISAEAKDSITFLPTVSGQKI